MKKSRILSFQMLMMVVGMFLTNVHLISQDNKMPPIIDVHVHAMKFNPGLQFEMCPWFLSDMPGGDPHQGPPKIFRINCVEPLQPATSDQDFQDQIIEIIESKNIYMVAGGDAEILHNWYNASPDRIIPSLSINSAEDMTVEAFRDSLSNGFYKVMGEVAPQYEGMSPSDMSLDAYFGVAEELGIPVGIHMGTGGNGMINTINPKYRASLGRPFILEDMLARHPKLKIWVMHAGYPMIDEMIALMGANAYVYVDLAGFIWSYPLEEVHAYLKRLVQAGFGKRILYGTDLLIWPKLILTSIEVIQNANYLSEDQKRDIFFNNAIRFFNLDPSKY